MREKMALSPKVRLWSFTILPEVIWKLTNLSLLIKITYCLFLFLIIKTCCRIDIKLPCVVKYTQIAGRIKISQFSKSQPMLMESIHIHFHSCAAPYMYYCLVALNKGTWLTWIYSFFITLPLQVINLWNSCSLLHFYICQFYLHTLSCH